MNTVHEQLVFDLDGIPMDMPLEIKPGDPIEIFPLNEYDHVILNISAGADSMGCLFELIKQGLDLSKLELWHQCVDGHGDQYREFWDWPCTESYIESVGKYFGVPVYYQWRDQGLYGELMRENRLTGDVFYEEDGQTVRLPTTKGKKSTRRKFPAQSADLQIRWCSAAAKSDPARRVLCNTPRLKGTPMNPKKILFITGERRSEGGNRANYHKAEKHISSTKSRIVHHWRPVIDDCKHKMFELHRAFNIMPHPAYYLGFGRVSCMGCVFSTKHQWKAIQHIAAERFQQFVDTEIEIGHTVNVDMNLIEKAAKGALEKVLPLEDPRLPGWIDLTLSRSFGVDDLIMKEWVMPIGADRGCEGGPQ
ncbi:phosphoadenosine phosphosulfate reductase family protein [Paenibacillus sp. NPDC093718]|uniref:phosphoadenosine phosphosulfate reductase family protein n=1 Tax=Paenibacillus sp. NPDC093718 TaxID=3390601 RepID=UPI003D051FCC